ncbi:MAG: ATP-binding protein [Acidobacteriota bacterium]
MTLRLKTRLTLVTTLLVLVVLTSVSLYWMVNVTRQLIQTTYDKGDLITKQIYDQVRQALASVRMVSSDSGETPTLSTIIQEALTEDPGLSSLFESTTGYSTTILYLAVTDPTGVALAHSDASQVGLKLTRLEDLTLLRDAGPLRQFQILYGPPKNYEVTFPMVDASNNLFGTVRVAINTAFLQHELNQFFQQNLWIAAIVLLAATLLSAVFSHLLLSPLTFISAGIERLIRGEFDKPIRMDRRDEFGLVSLKLNEIGQQLEVNREQIDALKGNIGQIVRSLEEKLVFINQDRVIILMSPSAAALLGTTVESALGRSLHDALSSGHPLLELVETAFGVGQSINKANLLLPKSEKPIAVKISLLEENQQRMGALLILHDPEAVARIENQLEYATKLSALNKLTSGVAHEVKNPLNSIVIHLELLRTRIDRSAPEAQKSLSVITQEIKRLDRVVRNFLNFSRPVEIKLQEADLPSLIQEVLALAETEARQRQVTFSFQAQDSLPLVKVDPDLVKQSLLNIVLNGCQAMPNGGELKIESRVENGWMQVSVQDSGIGIPPENREKIFNLYYTTKENGNGIGLSTVFKVMQLHNGEVQLDSAVGKGSTFVLKFPVQ